MLHQQLGQAQQHLLALGGRALRPDAGLEHMSRVTYRRVHIRPATGRDIGQQLAGGGIDRGERLPRLRGAVLTVDHGSIGKLQGTGLALPLCKFEHVECSLDVIVQSMVAQARTGEN